MRALLIVLVLLAAGGAAFYYLWPGETPPPPPPPVAQVEPAKPVSPFDAPPEPPKHPIETAAPTTAKQALEPLPPLKDSDATMAQALGKLLGTGGFERFLYPEDIVRRIVATIDNLPREQYASRLNPVKPMPGLFETQGPADALEISPKNTARYTAFLDFVDKVDARQAVDLYIHYYPLFQQAYVELGYPRGYFNDRVVEVIDHLLQAPEAPPPVRLEQPKVLYQYADPALEAKSAGHKAMMRMGSQNAARVKAKLREIRAALKARQAAR